MLSTRKSHDFTKYSQGQISCEIPYYRGNITRYEINSYTEYSVSWILNYLLINSWRILLYSRIVLSIVKKTITVRKDYLNIYRNKKIIYNSYSLSAWNTYKSRKISTLINSCLATVQIVDRVSWLSAWSDNR